MRSSCGTQKSHGARAPLERPQDTSSIASSLPSRSSTVHRLVAPIEPHRPRVIYHPCTSAVTIMTLCCLRVGSTPLPGSAWRSTDLEYIATDEVQQPEWSQAIPGHRLPRKKPRGKRVLVRSLRSLAASRHRGAAAASGVPGGALTSSTARRAWCSGRDGRRLYPATASNAKNSENSSCRVAVCDLWQHLGTAVRLLPALPGLHLEVGSTQEASSSLAKAVPNSLEHTVASHGAWGRLGGR